LKQTKQEPRTIPEEIKQSKQEQGTTRKEFNQGTKFVLDMKVSATRTSTTASIAEQK